MAYLLDIEKPQQITRDPLVGGMFENLVILEALKARYNQGRNPGLYFFRDSNGKEIDLLHRSGRALTGIEIKSGSTYHRSQKVNLLNFSKNVVPLTRSYLVFNGEPMEFSDGVKAIRFDQTASVFQEESS